MPPILGLPRRIPSPMQSLRLYMALSRTCSGDDGSPYLPVPLWPLGVSLLRLHRMSIQVRVSLRRPPVSAEANQPKQSLLGWQLWVLAGLEGYSVYQLCLKSVSQRRLKLLAGG
jgi:hypothetical protein